MPRIPYPSSESPSKSDNVRTLNVQRMFHYVPDTMRIAFSALAKELLWHGKLNPAYRELAIVHVGRLAGSDYELFHHEAFARSVGVSDAKLDSLRRGDLVTGFTAAERAVLAFTDEVARKARPSDSTLRDVQAHLSNGEIMELILAFGYYMTVSRILETFGPEMDDIPLDTSPPK